MIHQIRTLVQSPEIIVATWKAAKQNTQGLTEGTVRDSLLNFEELWSVLFPAEQARIVRLLVEKIVISPSGADITLRTHGLETLMEDLGIAVTRGTEAA